MQRPRQTKDPGLVSIPECSAAPASLDAMWLPGITCPRRVSVPTATLLLASLLASIAAACGGRDAVDEGPFVYDAGRPLSTTDRGVVDDDYPIAVHDLSYVAGGDTIDAFLAVPPGRARRPAVVYVHGAGSTRESMVGPALWLAARGAVTLAITAPSSAASAPAVTGTLDRLAWQRSLEIRDVIAVRRAVDFLSERDDVDPKRLGFVGWSAGARAGAILSGVEPRFHSLVLISGGSAPVSAFVQAAPAALRPEVEETMSSIDPLRYIAKARPGSLLLQDGRRDAVIPRDSAPEADRRRSRGHPGALVRRRSRARPDRLPGSHATGSASSSGIDGPVVPGAKSGP